MYPCQWLKIKSARNQTPDCSVVTTSGAIYKSFAPKFVRKKYFSPMDYKEITVGVR